MARARGFTLIELIITIVLLAIFVALAVPAFRTLILNNQRAAQVNAMVTSLTIARAEAVKRGTRARVCISDGADPPDCDAASTDWEDGWLVIADLNRNGIITRADEDDPADPDDDLASVLQIQAALAELTTLRGNTPVESNVVFGPRGFAAGTVGTLLHCDARGDSEARRIIVNFVGRDARGDSEARRIIVNFVGRPRTEMGAGGESCPP
jgi:type IV fimbrial biogenesis protein FimT